jgi:hypothetical protein
VEPCGKKERKREVKILHSMGKTNNLGGREGKGGEGGGGGLPRGTSLILIQNLATWQSLKGYKKLAKIACFMMKNKIIHNQCFPTIISSELMLLDL